MKIFSKASSLTSFHMWYIEFKHISRKKVEVIISNTRRTKFKFLKKKGRAK